MALSKHKRICRLTLALVLAARKAAAVLPSKDFPRNFILATLALCFCLWPSRVSRTQPQGYQIHEEERSVDLSTPYGEKEIIGSVGSENHRYRVEIPLNSLKPTPSPSPTPGSTAEKEAKELEKDLKVEVTTKKADDKDSDDDNEDDDSKSKRDPSSIAEKPTPPPVPTLEYDDTDRLILEANHLYNRGKFYEASIYVEELIRKKPKFLKGWIMKGSLLWIQGHHDLAKDAWQQALALSPDDQQVKDLLQRYR